MAGEQREIKHKIREEGDIRSTNHRAEEEFKYMVREEIQTGPGRRRRRLNIRSVRKKRLKQDWKEEGFKYKSGRRRLNTRSERMRRLKQDQEKEEIKYKIQGEEEIK